MAKGLQWIAIGVFALAAICECGCRGSATAKPPAFSLPNDQKRAEAILQMQIPKGMDVADARTVLRTHGFECTDYVAKDGPYIVGKISHYEHPLVETRYEARILIKDGSVEKVLLSIQYHASTHRTGNRTLSSFIRPS